MQASGPQTDGTKKSSEILCWHCPCVYAYTLSTCKQSKTGGWNSLEARIQLVGMLLLYQMGAGKNYMVVN